MEPKSFFSKEQLETIRFYTTNDYLLINGLLWHEDRAILEDKIRFIHEDGCRVMHEAREQGFDKRWNCSREEGERIYKIFEKRFPPLNGSQDIEARISRARRDIQILYSCMKPLETDLLLYRNGQAKYAEGYREGDVVDYLGFSSCSTTPHTAENEMYGARNGILYIIAAPKGTPALRLDQIPEIANEPDEVILPPMVFLIHKVEGNTLHLQVQPTAPSQGSQ